MYELIQRPVTEHERSRLLGCMSVTPPAPAAWRRKLRLDLMVQVAAFVTAAVALIWFKKEPASFVVPVVLVCWAVYWMFSFKGLVLTPMRKEREKNRAENERLAEFQKAVNAARSIRVQRVEAVGVVELMHDEGTICLFDLGDNRTYWIDPYSGMIPGRPPAQTWPNSKFEVVKLPGWKEELGPFCYGEPFRPRETLEFRDYFEEFDFDVPGDGLIDKGVDTFLQEAREVNLANLAASRRR